MPKSYIVDDDYNDSRLDKWFKNKVINLPHSLLEKILRQNKVKVNKLKHKGLKRRINGELKGQIKDSRGNLKEIRENVKEIR